MYQVLSHPIFAFLNVSIRVCRNLFCFEICALKHCGETKTNRTNPRREMKSSLSCSPWSAFLLSLSRWVSALGWHPLPTPSPSWSTAGSPRDGFSFKWEDAHKGRAANAFRLQKGCFTLWVLRYPWFLPRNPFSCCGLLWQSNEGCRPFLEQYF